MEDAKNIMMVQPMLPCGLDSTMALTAWAARLPHTYIRDLGTYSCVVYDCSHRVESSYGSVRVAFGGVRLIDDSWWRKRIPGMPADGLVFEFAIYCEECATQFNRDFRALCWGILKRDAKPCSWLMNVVINHSNRRDITLLCLRDKFALVLSVTGKITWRDVGGLIRALYVELCAEETFQGPYDTRGPQFVYWPISSHFHAT